MSGRKFKFALLMRVLICVICVGSMIGLAFMDSLFYVHAPGDVVTTAAFEPYPKEGTSENSRAISVYADGSFNMQGFYSQARKDCFTSAYAELLGSLEDHFEGYTLKYYRYLRSSITDCGKSGLLQVENGAEADGDREGGLVHVLETVAQGNSSAIIFTDLEGDSVTDGFCMSWQNAAESAFRNHKSISIVRYLSAYGGILQNYADSSINYSYGYRLANNGRGTNVKQLRSGRNYYHLLPRAFYAIVVGDAETTTQIVDSLNDAYDKVCRQAKNRNCHDEPAWEAYQAKSVYTLPIISGNTLTACHTEPQATGIYIDTNGLREKELKDSSLRDEYGVYSFVVKHTARDEDGFRIPFTISPALRSSGEKALLTQLFTEIEVMKLNEQHKTINPHETVVLGKDMLLARGNRVIQLTLDPYEPVQGSYRTEIAAQANGQVRVDLIANTGLVTQGVYRVKLHVYAKQDGKRMADTIENPLVYYSQTYTEAQRDVEALCEEASRTRNPMLKTPELATLLKDLKNSYTVAASENGLEIAQMTFDLYVE